MDTKIIYTTADGRYVVDHATGAPAAALSPTARYAVRHGDGDPHNGRPLPGRYETAAAAIADADRYAAIPPGVRGVSYISRVFDNALDAADDGVVLSAQCGSAADIVRALRELRCLGGNHQMVVQPIRHGVPWTVDDGASGNALVVLTRQVLTDEAFREQEARIEEMVARDAAMVTYYPFATPPGYTQARVYRTRVTGLATRADWLEGRFKVLARRADEEFPKAYVIELRSDGHLRGYYCAERITGAFEQLGDADPLVTFANIGVAVEYAESQGFTVSKFSVGTGLKGFTTSEFIEPRESADAGSTKMEDDSHSETPCP